MREEFSDSLRVVLDKAQQAARSLNRDFVGVEHLMLGVLECSECEAAQALRRGEVPFDDLRMALLDDLPRGGETPVVTGNLPLTPKAMRVVNEAVVHAQQARQQRVSTRMLLTALLDERDSAVRQALGAAGADVEHLRRVLGEAPVAAEQ